MSIEVLTDSENSHDDELMDQIDSETLKIVSSPQLNRINVDDKPVIEIPKTVIMYNCKMRIFHNFDFHSIRFIETEIEM